ncbi:TPA: hypothetical protein ACS62H_004661 [Klebsiella pneumoniae]
MTGFTEEQQDRKKIFLVEAEPFKLCGPEEEVSKFISERELVEETPSHYVVASLVRSEEVVQFSRDECVAFNTREEALIHLDRLAVDKVQELESQLNHWQQFINAVDEELRK